MFGWGTSGVDGANPPYFIDYSDNTNYSWSDWGQNQIGEYAPNTWRTPTYDDWSYLLRSRKVEGRKGYSYVRLRHGNKATDTVSGILLYPDDFSFSAMGLTIPVGEPNGIKITEIDADTWFALYDSGCAFLPACSNRTYTTDYYYKSHLIIDDGDRQQGYGKLGYYWSSTQSRSYSAYVFSWNCWSLIGKNIHDWQAKNGCSVRLIKDAE